MLNKTMNVHLGLFSQHALEILNKFTNMVMNVGNNHYRKSFNEIAFLEAPSGEICLCRKRDDSRYADYADHRWDRTIWARNAKFLSPTYARKYLANTIYNFMIKKTGRCNDYSRTTSKSIALPRYPYSLGEQTVKINEVHLIIDVLNGISHLERKYPAELITRVIGSEKDPVATGVEEARREAIAKAKATHAEQVKLNNEKCNKMIDELIHERDAKNNELNTALESAIDQINQEFEGILNATASSSDLAQAIA